MYAGLADYYERYHLPYVDSTLLCPLSRCIIMKNTDALKRILCERANNPTPALQADSRGWTGTDSIPNKTIRLEIESCKTWRFFRVVWYWYMYHRYITLTYLGPRGRRTYAWPQVTLRSRAFFSPRLVSIWLKYLPQLIPFFAHRFVI